MPSAEEVGLYNQTQYRVNKTMPSSNSGYTRRMGTRVTRVSIAARAALSVESATEILNHTAGFS